MIHYLLLSLIRTSGAVFVYVISLFRGPKYIFIITYFHLQIKVTTTSANIGSYYETSCLSMSVPGTAKHYLDV